MVSCYDCGRDYDFPDLLVPFDVWEKICPDKESFKKDKTCGGILCPTCICNRLDDEGITTKAIFPAGPITFAENEQELGLNKNIENHINWLEDQIVMLRKLLFYYYCPTSEEWDNYFEYTDQIYACGSCPPTEEEYFVDLLLTREKIK